ncbi:hypothetical protein PENSPDRAFT_758485 [Peniophora sp. CONT]|nr:hypothetical protein PENSPDRAFT_758485 [Peniophora sp. CONT]
MAGSYSQRDDSSLQSIAPPQDLSLGSLANLSGLSTPARGMRIPSSSTVPSSTTLATPTPPRVSSYIRKKLEDGATPVAKKLGVAGTDNADDYFDEEGDILNSMQRDRRMNEELGNASVERGKRSRTNTANGKSNNLTLRDQEKHIDNLKKENFNIKLKVHFLEERLSQLAPDQIEAALKQNIQLKIEVQERGIELKKMRKLVLELEKELQHRTQRDLRERELEKALAEREREVRELRRRGGSLSGGSNGGGAAEEALREVEERNDELEDELEKVRRLLQENNEELERLQDIVARRGDDSLSSSTDGGNGRLRRRMEELEIENEELRAALDEHVAAAAERDEEREELLDQNDALRLQLENSERIRQAESIERSESRAMILEEREGKEELEAEVNMLRDRLTSTEIELQQKDDELQHRTVEMDSLYDEHHTILHDVETEWKGELEEVKVQNEELRDLLEKRDAEAEELRMQINELEANTNALHEKFEAAFEHLEAEGQEKDEEIAASNREIEQLSQRIYELEEDNEKLERLNHQARADEAIEKERLEALSAALKQKVADLKAQLQEVTELYEQCTQDIVAHRERQEELARHVEDLVSEVRREREARERAEADFDKAEREFDADLRRERRTLEAKESALQTALTDLARAQSLLQQREEDLAALQNSLQDTEEESKRLGESHTTARFSLQLEVDRLKRDLERLEDEVARARKDRDDRETKARERDGVLDKLHAENRDLASQLAAQTQARLNMSEKLDTTQESLSAAESELAKFRARVSDLEQKLSKDQRSLLSAESQYRDQLTERNTLLLTIYQYMDKILGVDRTPKKSGQAETKPFTNFGVFHDNLITRLKALSQIQHDFDRRVKEAETKYSDRLQEIKKQLDHRWRQIDKFEASVKTMAEAKATWRRKLGLKEGELDTAKAQLSDLTSQLNILRRPGPGDSNEVKALMARANNAERRLTNAQNQLAAAEEKMANMNQKTSAADSKWEARVKEYETRLRAAEEKVKREKQGFKERVVELETQIKSLQRQKEIADKRVHVLGDIEAKVPRGSGSPRQ